MQRGRSPFAGRLGEELASAALVLHDDGLDPDGSASAPFDGEGVPRRRTALIEGGRLRAYLYDTYTANREGGGSTGSASATATAPSPRSRPRTWSSPPARSRFAELLGEAGDGVFVTDVAGLHSGVNPVTGVFSVGASGRAIRGGELAEPRARVHDRRRSGLDAGGGSAPPERRPAGSRSGARSARRRC